MWLYDSYRINYAQQVKNNKIFVIIKFNKYDDKLMFIKYQDFAYEIFNAFNALKRKREISNHIKNSAVYLKTHNI